MNAADKSPIVDLASSPVFYGGPNTANLQAVLRWDDEFMVHTRCFYSDGSHSYTGGEYFQREEQQRAISKWLERTASLREQSLGIVITYPSVDVVIPLTHKKI